MSAEKKQVVIEILENNVEIRDWYETEHNFSLDNARDTNCSLYTTYGTGAVGDTADLILYDGLRAGVITKNQFEEVM